MLCGMVKGAIHPNGANFRRTARLDVVARVRRMTETKLLERPKWLEWCERVPPMENHSLNLQARNIRSPYPQMVNFLLKKYPDLRFQDCYVDGNDWTAGNDSYRADHPVMQFVAKQLDFMRTEKLNKREAFERTEECFRQRREDLEQEQKVMMALALDAGLAPMFSTGKAYLQSEVCKAEAAHLNNIRRQLRELRKDAFPSPLSEGEAVLCREAPTEEGVEGAVRPFRRAAVVAVDDGQVTVEFFDGSTRQLAADSRELRQNNVAVERNRMKQQDDMRSKLVRSSILGEEAEELEEVEPVERADLAGGSDLPDEVAAAAGFPEKQAPAAAPERREAEEEARRKLEKDADFQKTAAAEELPKQAPRSMQDDHSFTTQKKSKEKKKDFDAFEKMLGASDSGVLGEDRDRGGSSESRRRLGDDPTEESSAGSEPKMRPKKRVTGRRGGGTGEDMS